MTCRHYARRVTLGMVVNEWVDRHPYLAFCIFLALMVGAMALCGLDDAGDRVAALGGY